MKNYPSPDEAMANAVGESQPEEGRACWVWHGQTRQAVAEELSQTDPEKYRQLMAEAVQQEANLQMGACAHACWYKNGQFVDLMPDGAIDLLEKPTHWQYREGPTYAEHAARVKVLQSTGLGQVFSLLAGSGITLIPVKIVRPKKDPDDRNRK